MLTQKSSPSRPRPARPVRLAVVSFAAAAFTVLSTAPAWADCTRHIRNEGATTYVVYCEGCPTRWKVKIDPGMTVGIGYTQAWNGNKLCFQPSHGDKKCYQIDASVASVGGCASIQHDGNTGSVVLNDPVDGDAAIIY